MRLAQRARPLLGPGSLAIEIVVTPGSGNGRALPQARELVEHLRAAGHQPRLKVFSDLDRLRRWAATSRTRCALLICVGGDGTQSAAAVGALRRAVPFLPVPSGFGNLFAGAFQQPRCVDRVVELLEHGKIIRVDVGLRNGVLFLCQESFGLLSEIQDRTEANPVRPRARWRRWLAYYRTALRHLRDTPLTPLQVAVDRRVVARDATIVTVSNVKTYGPWLRLTPGASPIDGLFDVFIVSGATKRQVLARLLRGQLRHPAMSPGTLLCRGRRVSVAAPFQARDELALVPRRLPVVISSETAEALHRAVARPEPVSQTGQRRAA